MTRPTTNIHFTHPLGTKRSRQIQNHVRLHVPVAATACGSSLFLAFLGPFSVWSRSVRRMITGERGYVRQLKWLICATLFVEACSPKLQRCWGFVSQVTRFAQAPQGPSSVGRESQGMLRRVGALTNECQRFSPTRSYI